MEEIQKPDEQKQLVVDILGTDGRVRCTKCVLRATRYKLYGNIAVQAVCTVGSCMSNGELCHNGEVWGVLTVNPGEKLDDDTVCVKDYSEGEGNLKTLLATGIVEKPHRSIRSGFVELPVCRLTQKGRDWVRSELAGMAGSDDAEEAGDGD